MANTKPRGRPPADGNFIVWTETLVESLLRLRFEKYAEPMTAARGTKSLRVAWADLAKDLTQHNNGEVVSVEQCRNKLKALRNKWLAYHSGMASEPVCLALMDTCWGSEKDEAAPIKSQRPSRPSLERHNQVKKPRVGASSASDAEGSSPISIAPAIAPPPPVGVSSETPILSSTAASVETEKPPSTAASSSRPTKSKPTQILGGGNQKDLASAATIASVQDRSIDSTGLPKLEKLIDNRFAKVLDNQNKQLKLAEEQNRLLTQILAALQRG